MRNLKFRVWNKKNKKWELGYDYELLGGFSMIGETMLFGQYTALLNSVSIKDLDQFEITQWAGVIDMDRKEIYENDIVEYIIKGRDIQPMTLRYLIVFYVDSYAWLDLRKKNNHSGFSPFQQNEIYGTPKRQNYSWWGQCKVVGNVYENPELLKNKK